MLSPNHRVLVSKTIAASENDQRGILVAAMDLIELPGVDLMDPQDTGYSHLIFARHGVILCNGAWTESFHAGGSCQKDLTLGGQGGFVASAYDEKRPL